METEKHYLIIQVDARANVHKSTAIVRHGDHTLPRELFYFSTGLWINKVEELEIKMDGSIWLILLEEIVNVPLPKEETSC